MRTGYLKLIIAVITVALIGIIAIQVYWVKNAVHLKEQDFDLMVSRSLMNVANQIQKDEAIRFLQSHELSDFLKNQVQQLPLEPLDSSSQIVSEDGLVVLLESNGLDDSIRDWHPEPDQELIPLDENNPVLERQDVFQQILIDFLKKNPNPNVMERLDVKRVHELITTELIQHGIKTDFHFGVVAPGNNILFKEAEIEAKHFLLSPYQIKLFGNDYIESPNFLCLYFPHRKGYLMQSMAGILSVSIVFILAICWTFWYTIKTIVSQKKVAMIKNDFINNMTHELKTPISTIALASEMLGDDSFRKSETQYHKYLGMIASENKRLGNLVEQVLQSAVLDKGDFSIKKESLSIHEKLEQVIESTRVKAQSKGGDIRTRFEASNDLYEVDKVHMSNVFYNLLDNAIKYTKERPDVLVYTKDAGEDLIIGFQDNGIGIKPADQQKIFDKLYRVPTGNVHDVKGFGLGLSYVKAIIEKHQSQISLRSKVGHGTTFEIKIIKHPKN